MISVDQMREFAEPQAYQVALHQTIARGGLDVDTGPAEFMSLHLDREHLAVSGLDLADLFTVLEDPAAVAAFVCLKLARFATDTTQEYGCDEEPAEPDDIEILPFDQGFLVGHLIEFAHLSTRPKELVGYLGRIRIPGARAYARELREMYDQGATS